MIFSDELAAFRERTTDPGYRALILLGTRQATTAALLLGTLKLERVAFLLTDETQNMPQEVATLLGVSAKGWLCPAGDHSSTLWVYEGLRQVLESWSDLTPAQIAVDVTGGLKPMSVGLEKAAHVLGLPVIYVQSDYAKQADGRSVIVPGTQRLEHPPDPYTVFGDLEAAEARRQFQHHQYAVAARLFGSLAARMNEPQLVAHQQRYTALAHLSEMYTAWDVLDFKAAEAQATLLLLMPLQAVSELQSYAVTLAAQHTALQRLSAISATVVLRDQAAQRTLADPDAVLPLLGTLHAAALRRAAQGRYDFAALFRYRCLELISQHRLASHGLLTNQANYKSLTIEKAELSSAFQDEQRRIGRKQPKGLPDRITLFDGYMLLAAFDDPLVHGYPIKQIEERSNARNHSVLAHGYQLIGRSEYGDFAEVVDQLIDRLFIEVLARNRSEWEATYRFIEL